MKQWAEAAATRALLLALRSAPLPIANQISFWFVGLLDRAVPRLRKTAYRNLSFALPAGDQRAITDGVFRSIARILVTVARFPSLHRDNISEWIRYEGLENYRAAKERGRGVLVATAHLGNWELSAFAHALMTEPMHVVVRPLDNKRLDQLATERRTLSGNKIIAKKEAARSILGALRKNEAVGILIDQNAGLQDGVFVPFFGKAASAGTAFARLAHRSGATVIPGYAVWSEAEGKYILHFETEVEMTGNAAADTTAIHARLESIVRRYPDQWLWIHRRWKTRPSGESPLY